MDLYIDSIATTSRAVLALCEHARIPVTIKPVSLINAEQRAPAFTKLNPNQMVPVLDDDGFVLTETSAILRYLATTARSSLYPVDLKPRTRADEAISWFESNLYKDLGFGFVYPQVLPHHVRMPEDVNHATIEWGRARTHRWFGVLDTHLLAHGDVTIVPGTLTIADLLGVSIISVAELVGSSFAAYPNIDRWYRAVTALPAWAAINVAFAGFVGAMRGRPFVSL